MFLKMRLIPLLAFLLLSTACLSKTIETTDEFVDEILASVKSETGFKRNVELGFADSLLGLTIVVGGDVDEGQLILSRDLANLAAEDNLMIGEIGYLVGFLLNPVLWAVCAVVGYFSRTISNKTLRIALVASAILGVSASLTPQFPELEIPRISIASVLGSLVYGWLALLLFKPSVIKQSKLEDDQALSGSVRLDGFVTSDHQAPRSRPIQELEEQYLEGIVADYRSGKIREGVWAKALIDADGDESKAYARYLQLMLDVVRTENH